MICRPFFFSALEVKYLVANQQLQRKPRSCKIGYILLKTPSGSRRSDATQTHIWRVVVLFMASDILTGWLMLKKKKKLRRPSLTVYRPTSQDTKSKSISRAWVIQTYVLAVTQVLQLIVLRLQG